MSNQRIIVEIDEQGNSSVELKGFQGKGCEAVIKALQAGDNVTSFRKKTEYEFDPKVSTSDKQKV